MSGVPEMDYRSLNTDATLRLAKAAQRAGVKRFIFLSSIAAQCDAPCNEVITEEMAPHPFGPYGLSKLAAERGLAELDLDCVVLRPVLVYGPGMTGNMARLVQIARSSMPPPFSSLTARRSLLSVDNLAAAIETVLEHPARLRRPFIVADAEALTVGEMISAVRRGLGRGPGLFPVPQLLLEAILRAAGRERDFQRLTQLLVGSSAALQKLGWKPSISTQVGLAAVAAHR
jgi:UDP-glucose 4-epimerase